MDSGRPFRINRSEQNRDRSPALAAKPPHAPDAASDLFVPEPADETRAVRPSRSVTSSEAPSEKPRRGAKAEAKSQSSRLPSLLKWFAILVAVALVAGSLFFTGSRLGTSSTLPIGGGYQAVTTVDGQIYFGKVTQTGDYIKIEDGYYLQPATDASSGEQANTGKLVRLSNRLYSPDGNITIPTSQILSFESLDPDGQIVQMMGK